jgi:hypothetical protein
MDNGGVSPPSAPGFDPQERWRHDHHLRTLEPDDSSEDADPGFSDRVALLAAGLGKPLHGDIDAIDVGAATDLSEFQSC